jgi:hypothetical protein
MTTWYYHNQLLRLLGTIPVVDGVWSEACTSTVLQLVPIFEGELHKQPKNKTKEGKKGQQESAKV